MISEKLLSRRSFAQGCAAVGAAAAMGVLGGCAAPARAEEGSSTDGASLPQYGFLADMGRCVGCKNCVRACREANGLGDGAPDRRRVETYSNSRGEKVYLSTSCMHCADPNCARVCPAGAITKGDAGIVAVDEAKCIGCKYCFQACPYGVPRYDDEAMDKCDCCLDAGVVPGEEPNCVRACKFGALEYGPLDELRERAEKRQRTVRPAGEAGAPSCLIVGEV